MSAENYIASAARALVEAAKQILAAHTGVDVDVDELFDVEVSADADSTEGESGAEVAGESADAIFDVDIEEPEAATKRMVAEGMLPENVPAEYAQYLSHQIELMRADIMDYERYNHPNFVLKQKLNELYDRLGMLNEDIGGGKTDVDSLKSYYERLEAIQKDGVKLT